MSDPTYYAIIPAEVRYDKTLKANEKLLYGEITCLTKKTGKCFATNSYFAKLYEVSKETISRWINNLKKRGYLKIEMEYAEGTNQIINRYIQINQYPIDEKINTPIDEKIKDNIRYNNTSINSTRLSSKEEQSSTLSKTQYGNPDINKLIKLVKEAVEGIGLIYKAGKLETHRAKNILTAKEYGDTAAKFNISRVDLAIKVIENTTGTFWHGKIFNCETLYSNYVKVINDLIAIKKENKGNSVAHL